MKDMKRIGAFVPKKFAALVFVVVMMLTFLGSAWAETISITNGLATDYKSGITDISIPIRFIHSGLSAPKTTLSFFLNEEPSSDWEDAPSVGTYTVQDIPSGAVSIKNDGKVTVDGRASTTDSTSTLGLTIDPTKFSQAGIYRCYIGCWTGANDLDMGDFGIWGASNGADIAVLDFYVDNNGTGSGYVVKNIVMFKENEQNFPESLEYSPEVSDNTATYSGENGTKISELSYEYKPGTTIIACKTDGSLANPNDEFTYTIESVFTANSDSSYYGGSLGGLGYSFSAQDMEIVLHKSDGTSSIMKGVETTSETNPDSDKVKFSTTFTLKNGEYVSFRSPVWAVTTVTQTENSSYTTTNAAVQGAKSNDTTGIFTGLQNGGSSFSLSLGGTQYIVGINNSLTGETSSGADYGIIAFRNTNKFISPTGLILRYAPYILMLGVGIFLFILGRKRRKDDAEQA